MRTSSRKVERFMTTGVFARGLLAGVLTVLLVVVAGCSPGTEDAASPTLSASSVPTGVASPERIKAAFADGAVALDVRTPGEFAEGHLDGARNLDVESAGFDAQLASLDRGLTYVVYCASGRRAGLAIARMAAVGFSHLVNGGGYAELVTALRAD